MHAHTSWLPFLVLGVLVTATGGVLAYLVYTGAHSSFLLLALVVETIAVLVALALFWLWLEIRVFRPLQTLNEQITIMTRSNAGYFSAVQREHRLGSLPDVVDELGQALLRARTEFRQSMDAAVEKAERREARLEAILRDLSQAVIVCNLEHRIALFNQAAARLLGPAGQIGLRRSLSNLIDHQELHHALSELQRRLATNDPPAVYSFECPLPGRERSLHARMSLVLESAKDCSGYVLSLDTAAPEKKPEPSVIELANTLPERPEFYDFALFEAQLEGPVYDRELAALDYVVFDTETTGLRPSAGDEIVQIAGVRVVNGRVLEGDSFDNLVNPQRLIPRSSTRFHGITDTMVAACPPASVVLRQFHRFATDSVLVAHNAAFDLKFLKLKEEEAGALFDHPVLDTLLLSVALHPSHETHTLDAIAERLDVEVKERHTALGDSITTAYILVKMFDVLAAKGIYTLRDAIEASDAIYSVRSLQEQF